jgi:hypothetical protein
MEDRFAKMREDGGLKSEVSRFYLQLLISDLLLPLSLSPIL